jgi:hypothetical protein
MSNQVKIKELVEKLFKVQGLFLEEDTLLTFIEEISRWNYPEGAIELGFKSLFSENLKEIKLFAIKNAIKNFIVKEEEIHNTNYCSECNNTGHISMFDPNDKHRYQTEFACFCKEGIEFARIYKVAVWSGQNGQYYKNTMLKPTHKNFEEFYG